jgi:hypothetical protein
MSCLGVHFALTPEQEQGLLSQPDDKSRKHYLQEHIERGWDPNYAQESDKAWDAIHRCLSDWPPHTPYFYPVDPKYGAYDLPENHGSYPLKLCVLGGRKLMDNESYYIIRLIEPSAARDIAEALKAIDKDWFRAKYFKHCDGAWPEYGEDDFEYCWEWFQGVRDFFARVAPTGRSVIFSADQ